MISTLFLVGAVLVGAIFLILVLTGLSRSRLQQKLAALRKQLNVLQSELQSEQGKSRRLGGFFARLQPFNVSTTGERSLDEFTQTLIDSIHTLVGAEFILLYKLDSQSQDYRVIRARGYTPEALAGLRFRAGDGILGKAAQSLKTVVQNSAASTTDGFTAPYLIVPLKSQAQCSGLLVISQPASASFSVEARELAELLAGQAALVLENHTFQKNVEELQAEAVTALARAIEAKDAITHRHSDRTRLLVRAFAEEIPLPEPLIRQVEYGAFLHDVGKIGIPDEILNKSEKLTPDEYAVMKNHPTIGLKILQPLMFLRAVGAIVLYHQEWYNGAGYPEGLAGDEIPLGARMVQVIDAWDAMTSDRPYRKAMPSAAAITELRRQAGTQFDPKLVDLFLRVIDRLERVGLPTTEHSSHALHTAQPA